MDLHNDTEKKIIEWIDNIVGKPTNELGFLASGAIQRWRLMQALTTISKARDKCIALNLPLKMISPKLICPLLENCSLEDDEYMQDKWANMLVNMLDSTQNLQNHIFPFLLSQISKNEFIELNTQYELKEKRMPEIKAEATKINQDLDKNGVNAGGRYMRLNQIFDEYRKLEVISLENIEGYEIANVIRLGIVRSIQLNEARAVNQEYKGETPKIFVGETGYEYVFTELGEIFFKACSDKMK